MASRSEIWIKDATGAKVDILDEVREYRWSHALNAIGELAIRLDPRAARNLDLLVEGVPIEIWRRVDGAKTPYLEWEGLIVDTVDSLSGAAQIFEVRALGYLDLIDRRVIAYPHGHARTIKDQIEAETIIKEFVDHNVGPNATTGGGRVADGTTPGLTVQVDTAAGPVLSGQGTFVPLLDILQRVAAASAAQGVPTVIDFDIIGTGASGGLQTFEFRTFLGGRGSDRSAPAAAGSHLNAAGFRPLVFNPELGNLEDPSFRTAAGASRNRVFALGRGAFNNQIVRTANNLTAQTANLSLREMVFNAQDAQDNDATDAAAEAEIARVNPASSLDGSIIQTGEALYGRDYVLGDTVSLRFRDFQQDRRVAAVTVTVERGREGVSLELSEPTTDAPQ
jgi:hypothetical protein